jgi:hypothetical protein
MRTRLVRRRPEPRGASRGPDRGVSRSVTGPASWGLAERRGARAVGSGERHGACAVGLCGASRARAARSIARAGPSGRRKRPAGAWPWGCAEGRGARAVGLGEALRAACPSGRSVARGPGRGAARSVRRAQPWGCRAIGSMTRSAPGRHWSGDPLVVTGWARRPVWRCLCPGRLAAGALARRPRPARCPRTEPRTSRRLAVRACGCPAG